MQNRDMELGISNEGPGGNSARGRDGGMDGPLRVTGRSRGRGTININTQAQYDDDYGVYNSDDSHEEDFLYDKVNSLENVVLGKWAEADRFREKQIE